METLDQSFSIAVFPFLKTSEPVRLGELVFRSTEDVEGLGPSQAAAVREVAGMLFLQDHLRIKAATYAIVPHIDLRRAPLETDQLENTQAVIAYLYASPHEIFGNAFLSTEHATIVVLSPDRGTSTLVRSLYNVIPEGAADLGPEDGHVDGFAGLYNFRHRFWVTSGSRIYGPLPHPVLNISQDLSREVGLIAAHDEHRHLLDLLRGPTSQVGASYLTAIRWYTSAHLASTDEFAAIVHLSIAFEALLGLPQGEKTDRLVDAISLLLGRIPRLDVWARQFYDARSQIVHEGRADVTRFAASSEFRGREGQLYQPLFSYGTQIFRLCLATLLVGRDLAERVGLERRFVTNQERYTKLCETLDDANLPPMERLAMAAETVRVIDEMQFVGEAGLKLETMIGAVRRASKLVLESDSQTEPQLRRAMSEVVNSDRTKDHFDELGTILALDEVLRNAVQPTEQLDLIRQLVKCVAGSTFMHYYWLKRAREGSHRPE